MSLSPIYPTFAVKAVKADEQHAIKIIHGYFLTNKYVIVCTQSIVQVKTNESDVIQQIKQFKPVINDP